MSEHLTARCHHDSELVSHCRECVGLLVRVQKAATLYRKAERADAVTPLRDVAQMMERLELTALLDDALEAYEKGGAK